MKMVENRQTHYFYVTVWIWQNTGNNIHNKKNEINSLENSWNDNDSSQNYRKALLSFDSNKLIS